MAHVYPFAGVIQHYAWGGYDFLPDLLHLSNEGDRSWAELWMGAHPKGPGRLTGRDGTLVDLIEQDPAGQLGARVAQRFDEKLPFLLKILDVREMLSIQVHPDKEAAERGYAKEEKNGPARDAPDRNYRDDNHKPELGVALTDFYLLHGFRAAEQIKDTLTEVPGWHELLEVLNDKGVKGLYAHVMHADQSEIDRLLTPFVDTLGQRQYSRDQARFWAKRAVEQYSHGGHHDRGMFSIMWFNLVHLRPGEGIFQDAGIPHAYLEGVCIELMANSDNVLRGGLTPKHIDVPELLDKTRFSSVNPHIIRAEAAGAKDTGTSSRAHWKYYPTPAPDFKLLTAKAAAGDELRVDTTDGAAILLLLSGKLLLNGTTVDEGNRTIFLPAGQHMTLQVNEQTEVYLATTNQDK